jgi:hypothetical protein
MLVYEWLDTTGTRGQENNDALQEHYRPRRYIINTITTSMQHQWIWGFNFMSSGTD